MDTSALKHLPSDTKTESEFLVEAYQTMALIRRFEKDVWDQSAAQPPAVIGSVHLCAGQEAIPVGACAALDASSDKIICTYRGHGWALAWGLEPESVYAEIAHRENGINGGRAGSALIMDPASGFIGENSIVGAGAPIANGVAMAEQLKGSAGVVLVSVGDGAMNQGAMHEALVFAVAKSLPVIFVCENNGWSEMTPTDRIVPIERMSKRASGYGMPGVTIDGNDPLAVRDTIAMAADRARRGEGPTFVECKTARLWGHYNRDIEHYRAKEDRKAAEAADPLPRLRDRLLSFGIPAADVDGFDEDAETIVATARDAAFAGKIPNPDTALDFLTVEQASPRTNKEENDDTVEMTYQQAVNEALRRELADRPDTIVFGEDVGHAGGIFGCTRNLQKEFGVERVFDTPIAEAAILGAAVGAAINGVRPVAEIMWADFSLVALDQLFNQAANISYVTRGQSSAPMVVRMQQGATPGSCAQHSQCLEALMAHIPGLKIGLPATPQDAYSMLRAAIADPNPVIVVEARSLYQTKGNVNLNQLNEEIGESRIVRNGSDATIISYGTALTRCAEAADTLAENGIDVRLIDLRWLNPIDWSALRSHAVATGGRALVVHEANLTGGFGAEIVARLSEGGITNVMRLGAKDTRIPAAPALQDAVLPSATDIVSTVRSMFQ